MKNLLLFTLLIFILSSCTDKLNNENERLKVETNRLNSDLKLWKQESDSLNIVIKVLRDSLKELEKVKFELNPSGWIYYIDEDFVSTNYYVLYKNGQIVATNSLSKPSYYKRGQWKLTTDSLIFFYNEFVYDRPIGEPIRKGGAHNVPDTYEEYVKTKQTIRETESYLWSSWKESVKREGYWSIFSKKPSNFPYHNFDFDLPGNKPFLSYVKLSSILDLWMYKIKETNDELIHDKNEIFARYGLIFKSDELNEYFKKFSWYEPKYNNVDKYLSEIERNNLVIINEFLNNN